MACMRHKRNAYGVLVGKPEGKVSFRKPSCRCHGDIAWNLKGKGWERMGRTRGLISGKVVESCEHGHELPGSIKYGEFLDNLVID